MNLTFSQALEHIKNGLKMQRVGWNGKGMYIFLNQGHPVNGFIQPSKQTPPEELPEQTNKPGQLLSFIVMKTAGDSQFWGVGYNDYVPWLASQTDILANDWQTAI